MNSKLIAVLFGLLALMTIMVCPILGENADEQPKESKSTESKSKKAEVKETKPAEPVLIASPDVATSVVFPSTNAIEKTFKIGEIADLVFWIYKQW